jgi:hypothetical protein
MGDFAGSGGAGGGGGSGGVGAGAACSSGSRTLIVGQACRTPRAGMEVATPFDYGTVNDFDALEALWSHGFRNLRADPRSHPAILVEPAFTLQQQREKQAELMFEGQGVPFLYLAAAPVCQAFSAGRASAMVLDIGFSSSRVTPVSEGYVLKKGHLVSEVGASFLSAALYEALQKEKRVPAEGLLPRALVCKVPASGGASSSSTAAAGGSLASGSRPVYTAFPRPGAAEACSKSLRKALILEVMDDMKESCMHVAEIGYDASRPPPETSYELPDGTIIHPGALRETIPELHFNILATSSYKSLMFARQAYPGWNTLQSAQALGSQRAHSNHSIQPYPLHHLLHQSLTTCQPAIRKDLCHNSEWPICPWPSEAWARAATLHPPPPPLSPHTHPKTLHFLPLPVILTGGGSLLSGLSQRLYWETLTLIPAAFKPRILTASPHERRFSSWIGASILASLGTFQQCWISKAEYDEFGPSVVMDRCP